MGTKAGVLLWRRTKQTLVSGSTDVDTLLTQPLRAFAGMSPNEPSFGASGVAEPPPGTGPVSRVHVIPMAPTPAWADITHGEPYFNTTTGTVHVVFTNAGDDVDINVLFWAPHSSVGPGQADHYNAAIG